ncbi:sushi, von Willebrand factor type A, EGF and pentraxin domain-containing protein 1-like [Diadema antillarum]|uniref:sushi, von Willebrand factor type A, EGF and pentraxin domain-containing protein 1-like n=1 Tax=Diadema antillarum TaxID=105358 RepID=UPI003A86AC8F
MINEGNRREVYRDGDVVYYQCNVGFTIRGSQSNQCTANGRWAYLRPRCISIYNDCPWPNVNDIHLNLASFDPPNPSSTEIAHGTRVEFTCQRGYEFINGASETVCHDGRLIQCEEGYTTTDPDLSRCDDGIWIQQQTGANSSAPRCDPDPCMAIPNENVTVRYGRDPRQDGLYENGTTATAQCDDGYLMAITSETFVCRASRWIPATPKCLLDTNLAIGSTPSQSELQPTAHLAIDGRINGHYSGHSCTRIEDQLAGAAVRVGSLQNFRENPQCGGNITQQQILQSTPDNHGINIICEDEMTGKYVSIDLPPSSAGRSFLLCEVKVFGTGPIKVQGEQSRSPSELEGCTIPQVTNARLVTDHAPGQVIPAKPTGGTEEERGNDLRGVVKYRCDDGHAIAGSTVKSHKMTCLNVTGWDSDPPICVPVNCTAQSIENGRLLQYEIGDIIPHDSVVLYACNDGYEGAPSDSVECRHGNLFPAVPTCSPASCGVEGLNTSNMVVKVRYNHGERMELQCRPGYELSEQVPNLQQPLCVNGEWNHTQLPACRRVSCGEPGRSNDITIENIPQEGVEGYVHGARIRYVCPDGYTMTGNAVRDCLYGQWSGSVPECLAQAYPQHCRLPTATNGEMYSLTGVDPGDDVFGRGVQNQRTVQVSVSCSRRGYVPEGGSVSTTCINGTWTVPLPQCVARPDDCRIPDQGDDVLQFVNGDETQEISSYHDGNLPNGTVLVSRCTHPERYFLQGDTTRTCLRSRWTGSVPNCTESTMKFSFSHTQIQTRSDGTLVIVPNRTVHIDCDTSALGVPADIYAPHLQVVPLYFDWKPLTTMRLTIPSPTPQDSGAFTCRSPRSPSLHFHTIHVEFAEYRCPAPSWPAYGRVVDPEGGTGSDSDGYPMTKTMLFECQDGYQLNGASYTTCVLGEWSHPTPRCERVKCRELSPPTNGNMLSRGVNAGDEAHFDCDYGYERRGSDLLTCGSNGQWSHEPPTCHDLLPCGVAGTVLEGESLVNNSFEASEKAWPWLAYIFAEDDIDGSRQLCSGALICNHWVLTAASCFDNLFFFNDLFFPIGPDEANPQPFKMKVVLGEHNTSLSDGCEQTSSLENFVLHHDYDVYAEKPGPYNFALVNLTQPVELSSCVRTVCLPPRTDLEKDLHALHSDAQCYVTGWGSSGLPSPDQSSTVPLQSPVQSHQCRTRANHTGPPDPDTAAKLTCPESENLYCRGDRGSPLFCPRYDGESSWSLEGVGDGGKWCPTDSFATSDRGYFARIDVDVVAWINDITADCTANHMIAEEIDVQS